MVKAYLRYLRQEAFGLVTSPLTGGGVSFYTCPSSSSSSSSSSFFPSSSSSSSSVSSSSTSCACETSKSGGYRAVASHPTTGTPAGGGGGAAAGEAATETDLREHVDHHHHHHQAPYILTCSGPCVLLWQFTTHQSPLLSFTPFPPPSLLLAGGGGGGDGDGDGGGAALATATSFGHTETFSRPYYATRLALSRGNRYLSVGYSDGSIRLWEGPTVTTLRKCSTLKTSATATAAFAYTNDSPSAAAVAAAATAVYPAPILTLHGHRSAISSLAWGTDSRGDTSIEDDTHLVSGSGDGDIIVWDRILGAGVCRLHGHSAPVTALLVLSELPHSYDPLRTGGADTTKSKLAMDTSETTSATHLSMEGKIAIFPDGTQSHGVEEGAAAAMQKPTTETTETRTIGRRKQRRKSPLLMVSGGKDGVVKLWDLDLQLCLQTLVDAAAAATTTTTRAGAAGAAGGGPSCATTLPTANAHGEVWSLATDTAQEHLLVGCADHVIRIYKLHRPAASMMTTTVAGGGSSHAAPDEGEEEEATRRRGEVILSERAIIPASKDRDITLTERKENSLSVLPEMLVRAAVATATSMGVPVDFMLGLPLFASFAGVLYRQTGGGAHSNHSKRRTTCMQFVDLTDIRQQEGEEEGVGGDSVNISSSGGGGRRRPGRRGVTAAEKRRGGSGGNGGNAGVNGNGGGGGGDGGDGVGGHNNTLRTITTSTIAPPPCRPPRPPCAPCPAGGGGNKRQGDSLLFVCSGGSRSIEIYRVCSLRESRRRMRRRLKRQKEKKEKEQKKEAKEEKKQRDLHIMQGNSKNVQHSDSDQERIVISDDTRETKKKNHNKNNKETHISVSDQFVFLYRLHTISSAIKSFHARRRRRHTWKSTTSTHCERYEVTAAAAAAAADYDDDDDDDDDDVSIAPFVSPLSASSSLRSISSSSSLLTGVSSSSSFSSLVSVSSSSLRSAPSHGKKRKKEGGDFPTPDPPKTRQQHNQQQQEQEGEEEEGEDVFVDGAQLLQSKKKKKHRQQQNRGQKYAGQRKDGMNNYEEVDLVLSLADNSLELWRIDTQRLLDLHLNSQSSSRLPLVKKKKDAAVNIGEEDMHAEGQKKQQQQQDQQNRKKGKKEVEAAADAPAHLVRRIAAPGHRGTIRHLSISHDSSLLLSLADEGLKVWTVHSRKCVKTLALDFPRCGFFLAGNEHVVIGTRGGEVVLVDVAACGVQQHHAAHTGPVEALAEHPQHTRFASVSADKTLKVFILYVERSSRKYVSSSSSSSLSSPSTSSSSSAAAAVVGAPGSPPSSPRKPKRRCLGRSSHTQQLTDACVDHVSGMKSAQQHASTTSAESAAAAARTTAIEEGEGCCIRFRQIGSTELPDAGVALQYTLNGKYIACALQDMTILLFYTDSNKLFLSLYGHQLSIYSISVSSDSTLLASGSGDKTVKIWNIDFGNIQQSLLAHEQAVTQVLFLFQTHYLLSASLDGSVKLWDVDRRHCLVTILNSVCLSPVTSLAATGDGDMIFAAHASRLLECWRRSQDQLFVEEEQQRRWEEAADKQALREDALVGATASSTHVVLDRTTKRTMEALRSTERLMEVLDEAREQQELDRAYWQTLRTWEEQQTKNNISTNRAPRPTPPAPKPELMGRTAAEHVLHMLTKLRSSDALEVLVALPFDYARRLLTFIVAHLKTYGKISAATKLMQQQENRRVLEAAAGVVAPHDKNRGKLSLSPLPRKKEDHHIETRGKEEQQLDALPSADHVQILFDPVETQARVALIILQLHFKIFLACPSLRPLLARLRACLRPLLLQERDRLRFNSAACAFFERHLQQEHFSLHFAGHNTHAGGGISRD